MLPPDRSRHATRRRLRVFMAVCLLAVLVVGFWPVRGYVIDEEEAFRVGLGPPLVHNPYDPTRADTPIGLMIEADDYVLDEKAIRDQAFMLTPAGWPILAPCPSFLPRARVFAAKNDDLNQAFVIFQCRNLFGLLIVDGRHPNLPEGRTAEEVAFERLDAILDALESEASGVRRIYLPPAVQLWRGDIQPFLQQLFP